MPDFSKLIFLPLDMSPPPDISKTLDEIHNKGIDEKNMVTDSYRVSPSIILMTKQGHWLPGIEDKIPEFVKWAETQLFSWAARSQMVVITTPSGSSMAPHIDCSPQMFTNTWQHKFRCVIRGNTDTLRYIKNDGYVFVPDCENKPYIIKGSWPHDMHNDFPLTKYTLCLGAPWEPDINDIRYMDMLNRSYKKNKEQYLSYENWELPSNFRDLFNRERYGTVGEEVTLNI